MQHLGSDTPSQVKGFYRAVIFISMFWTMTVEPRMPGLSEHLKYIIDSFLTMGSGGIYFICQFFGWSVPTADELKKQVNMPRMVTPIPVPDKNMVIHQGDDVEIDTEKPVVQAVVSEPDKQVASTEGTDN